MHSIHPGRMPGAWRLIAEARTARTLRFPSAVVAARAASSRFSWQIAPLRPSRAPKASVVNDSLSIILPVRDAEATLNERVHRLLDLVPDLTRQFEILVVDDGSGDHTLEVARELARQYPQVRPIALAQPSGRDVAIKTGLSQAQGRTVLVSEDGGTISPTDLRRLWSLRHDRGVVIARAQQRPGALDPGLLDRLTTWGQALRNLARRTGCGGIQMIRRDEAQSLAPGNASSKGLQFHIYDR
jgi:glycosyltransferase involved in cell wall biosynthesis